MMGRKPLSDPAETAPGRRILLALGRYHYLTLEQIRRYCGFRNYEYGKLHVRKLAKGGYVFNENYLPRSDGKNASRPSVVSLTDRGNQLLIRWGLHPQAKIFHDYKRKDDYLRHTHAVNDVLIAFDHYALLSPDVELRSFMHDRVLKHYAPSVTLPDGTKTTAINDAYIAYSFPDGTKQGFGIEVDLGTEKLNDPYQSTNWQKKIARLVAFAGGAYRSVYPYESLTYAVAVNSFYKASPRRMDDLLSWTEFLLKDAPAWGDMFVFTCADPVELSPEAFIEGHHWISPFSRHEGPLVSNIPVLAS